MNAQYEMLTDADRMILRDFKDLYESFQFYRERPRKPRRLAPWMNWLAQGQDKLIYSPGDFTLVRSPFVHLQD